MIASTSNSGEAEPHTVRTSGPVPNRRSLLIADFRDALEPFLVLDIGREGTSSFRRQLIPLVATNPGTKGTRWYLQCPVTHKRGDYLLLRNGLFASAKAHRLVHRSQRN